VPSSWDSFNSSGISLTAKQLQNASVMEVGGSSEWYFLRFALSAVSWPESRR
jgi:hypothetical protein